METFMSSITNYILGSEYLRQTESIPYLKTAGTVLLGWVIVTCIWNIILVLFAPAAVSALAVLMICPATLEWLVDQVGPPVQGFTMLAAQKLRSTNLMNQIFP